MERWRNKVAVVTGASTGIGAAIVQSLLKSGLNVVGLARRVELMADMQKQLPLELQESFSAFKCDVSDVQSVDEAFDKVIARWGGIDILVNGAGVMNCGSLLTDDVAAIQEVLQTNVMGVIHCTQRAFKSMRERNFDGHVILINSIVGHNIPCFPKEVPPMYGIYIASKYTLRALTELYRQEFRHFDSKIKITSISPGVVDTSLINDFLRACADGNILGVDDVASSVLYAIATPPNVQVHEMIVKPVAEFAS